MKRERKEKKTKKEMNRKKNKLSKNSFFFFKEKKTWQRIVHIIISPLGFFFLKDPLGCFWKQIKGNCIFVYLDWYILYIDSKYCVHDCTNVNSSECSPSQSPFWKIS